MISWHILIVLHQIVVSNHSVVSNSAKHQLRSILDTLSNTLKIVATAYPRDPKKPFNYALIVFDSFHELVAVRCKILSFN